MKKLVLSLAVLFGVAMVSCGGDKKDANCDSTQVDMTEEVAVVEDSTAAPADSAAAPKEEGAEVKEDANKAEAPAADKAEKDAPKEDSAKK